MYNQETKTQLQARLQQLEAENQQLVSELISLKYKDFTRKDQTQDLVKTPSQHQSQIEYFFNHQKNFIRNENSAEYKNHYNAFSLPVFTFKKIDNDFQLSEVNKKAIEYTKGKIKNIIGCLCSEIWKKSPELIKLFKEGLTQKGLKHFEGEYTFYSTGKTAYILATYDYIQKDTVHVVVEDFTETKANEKLIKETIEQFDLFINTSPDIFCMKDGEGKWQLANKEILQVFNIDENNYKGKRNIELTQNNDKYLKALSFCDETDEIAWKQGKSTHVVERIPGKNETQYYDIYKIPLFNKDGSRKMLIVQGRNITQRIKNERELKKARIETINSELKLKKIINALPDAMFILDSNGIIIDHQYSNNFVEFIVSDETELKPIESILHKKIAENLKHHVSQVLKCHYTEPFDFSFKFNEKEVYFESRISRLDEQQVVALLRNVTESKLQEKELIIAKNKAEESDNLKSAFIANLSHEIRTPLNGIIGFSEMLGDANIDNSKRKKFSNIIIKSSRQLLAVLNDLLDISVFDSGNPAFNLHVFNLNSLLKELFHKYTEKYRNKPIDFNYEFSLEEDQSYIKSDRYRFYQICNIFLSNAFKFTTGGSIKISYTVKNKMITLSVSDTGIGIEDKYHQKIFERFFQIESAKMQSCSGTGLGLALAKRITDLFNGSITVKSKIGEGSTFSFSIPYQKASTKTLKA